MPTYEYACKSCEHRFEIVQSFHEDALTTCPTCEDEALRKVFSAAGIIFKGDGWHIKDYGGTSATPASTGAGSSTDSSTGGDTTSSDTTSTSSDTSSSSTSSSSGSGSEQPAA